MCYALCCITLAQPICFIVNYRFPHFPPGGDTQYILLQHLPIKLFYDISTWLKWEKVFKVFPLLRSDGGRYLFGDLIRFNTHFSQYPCLTKLKRRFQTLFSKNLLSMMSPDNSRQFVTIRVLVLLAAVAVFVSLNKFCEYDISTNSDCLHAAGYGPCRADWLRR